MEIHRKRGGLIANNNKKGIKLLLSSSCTPKQSSCSCPDRTSCSPWPWCLVYSWCWTTVDRSVIWSDWRCWTCLDRVRWSNCGGFGGICRGLRSSCFGAWCTSSCWLLSPAIGVLSFSARLFLAFLWDQFRWASGAAFRSRPIRPLLGSGPLVKRSGCAVNSVRSTGLTFRLGFLWGRTLLFPFFSWLRSPGLLVQLPFAAFPRWGLSFPT